MKKTEAFVKKISGLPWLVIIILLFIGVELFFMLHVIPGFTAASGGAPLLDLSFVYSPEHVEEFLAGLEAGGLSWYRQSQILDFFFPAVYGLMGAAIIYRIYRKKYENWNSYRWMVLFPVLPVICDYGENICIAVIMAYGRNFPPSLGWIVSGFSTVKFAGIVITLLFMFSGLGYFLKGKKDSAIAPGERARKGDQYLQGQGPPGPEQQESREQKPEQKPEE